MTYKCKPICIVILTTLRHFFSHVLKGTITIHISDNASPLATTFLILLINRTSSQPSHGLIWLHVIYALQYTHFLQALQSISSAFYENSDIISPTVALAVTLWASKSYILEYFLQSFKFFHLN